MKISTDAIINAVRNHPGGAPQFRELMQRFGIDRGRRPAFQEIVDRLVDEGRLVRLKGNRFTLAAPSDLVTGRVVAHRNGYGFVVPEGGGEDIFIPARHLRGNFHGDRVEVRVTARKDDGRREGRVVRTVEHALTRIVGRYEQGRTGSRVVADEPRITQQLVIPAGAAGTARDGQTVVAEIVSWPTEERPAAGRVVEVLGWPDDPAVEVLAIIRKHDLPDSFPEEVLIAARAVPRTVGEALLAGRVDLRDRPTVTIDGETARDFDDAVSVEREGKGGIRLWVSIADVAHYVTDGSPLDREAYCRGTSVYFPDRCIPMLPEELSNGICSLNPEVDRLTMTAELLVDRDGLVKEERFYPSVIRSAARLTYTEVARLLEGADPDAAAARSGLLPHLKLLEELALRLMARRRQRGSIDFDLPEPDIVIDLQGEVQAIVRAERTIAHRVIEECMLAANEAVARFIEASGVHSLYRVHEPPKAAKLDDFGEVARSLGHDFPQGEAALAPGVFQELLAAVAGRPEERLVNQLLLRCMQQARYAAENLGHFGLAADAYTHFTSPIRRYPDLVVHRILKATLAGRLSAHRVEQLAEELPEVAAETSRRERLAMEAEREIVELKKLQFMVDKVGEEFDGFVSGVTPTGLFVELSDIFVEGMVPLGALPLDSYVFREKEHILQGERTRRMWRLGDPLRVRVAHVSLIRRQMEFIPADAEPAGFAPAPPEEYPRIPVKGKPIRKVSGRGEAGSRQGGKKTVGRPGGKLGGPRRRR
jgi:ribonuclease R